MKSCDRGLENAARGLVSRNIGIISNLRLSIYSSTETNLL